MDINSEEAVARRRRLERRQIYVRGRAVAFGALLLLVAAAGVLVIAWTSAHPHRVSVGTKYVALVLGLCGVGGFAAAAGWTTYKQEELDAGPFFPDLDQRFDLDLEAPEHGAGQPPGDPEQVAAELVAIERTARQLADLQNNRASHWRWIRYGFGFPATAVAGLAGVTAISGVSGTWQKAIGVVALLGTALVGAVTTLDPARNENEAQWRSSMLGALGTEVRLARQLGLENGQAPVLVDVYLFRRRLQTLSLGAGTATNRPDAEQTTPQPAPPYEPPGDRQVERPPL